MTVAFEFPRVRLSATGGSCDTMTTIEREVTWKIRLVVVVSVATWRVHGVRVAQCHHVVQGNDQLSRGKAQSTKRQEPTERRLLVVG